MLHLAKGLEFKLVSVMACDDKALPLQSRVDEATDEDELNTILAPVPYDLLMLTLQDRKCVRA